MIASARYMGDETYPTVELALYDRDFDAGDSDGRLTGETEFLLYKVRQFFPSSGCGMIMISDSDYSDTGGTIQSAEPGLQNFVGRRATWFSAGEDRSDIILVVWRDEPNFDVLKNHRSAITKTINALSFLFT